MIDKTAYGLLLLALGVTACATGPRMDGGLQEAVLTGSLTQWQPVVLSFEGPSAEETDEDPNPFLDYRLQVRFTGPSGQAYDVPGFFDGDGEGGAAGNVWRVRFTPDAAGPWTFHASFRQGPEVAVALDPEAGRPAGFDGASGRFDVRERDPEAPGFYRWGRLQYAGGHYLKFADGPYWIKGGTDSPENLLAYAGFDNTPPSHHFAAHVEDWRPSDPDWGGGKGRGLIGALNYLTARHVNSIYFLPMNVGGDGQDVWPWAGTPEPGGSPGNDNLHYDVGKLRQWETVFAHAQQQGLFLHFVLNEAEAPNKRELDDGELGVERKLYYRELVARFAHHLALQWNLCEEYNLDFDLGPERVRAFAGYLRAVDPYGHPITVHSAGDPLEMLRFTFGDTLFSMTSIQLNQRPIDHVTEAFREATAEAGRPLPVAADEFTVDVGQEQSWVPFDNAELSRKQKLWPVYLSGGMIEFILEGFLEVDTFKTEERQALWDYMWYARKFMEEHLPFWEMEPADTLLRGEATLRVGTGGGGTYALEGQVLAKGGEVYAVYLPHARPAGTLDLTDAPRVPLTLRWYNPRTGAFEGPDRDVLGGSPVALGTPPREASEDWVVLIRKSS